MENILELQQVSKTFSKSKFSLENVSFNLPYGACWRKWSRKNNDDWLHIKYNKKGQRKDKTVWTGNVRRRHRYA